jgi:FixJ family two-component response regulator
MEKGRRVMLSGSDSNSAPHDSESEIPVVYVIDDDEEIRLALSALLRSTGLRVETFGSSKDFLAFPKYDAPSCLILDVRLRGESGLTFQEELARTDLRIPIVFITGHGDTEMSAKAMSQRRAAEESIATLRSSYGSLTHREREVMGFVVAGLMNKQIASAMRVSEITVKIHRGQMMKRLACRSVADLVRMAEALGVGSEHLNIS